MNNILKERWTEAQVEALPNGEHDFFERKSGVLVSDPEFRKDMGKAISALANSGGGHIVLGVRDDRTFDGVEPLKSGRTSMRDWLEQVVPNLVAFPLVEILVVARRQPGPGRGSRSPRRGIHQASARRSMRRRPAASPRAAGAWVR